MNKLNDENLEFEGKTVEEAISKAVKMLRVKKSDLNVKIVCEEKKGLFGMPGEKQAKIIVKRK